MAAQTLVWGLNSYGAFNNATLWVPREAPTPNAGQNLNILGGSLTLNGVALDDYTFNLLPGSPYLSLILDNQVIDAETLFRQTAPVTYINAYNGVTNFGEMQFGATGVPTSTNLTLVSGSVFRNTGTIEVSGTFVANGPGTFVNNGTFGVDGGVALLNNLTYGQAGSSFIIEGGTLELNGYTNSSVSFVPGTNGRLLFDQPGAANAVASIKGFDKGDEIVIQGGVASANYIGDAAGGTLFLADAAGAEVGRIPFAGAYALADFAFAPAPGGKTAIGSNKAPPPPPDVTAGVATTAPVLDLDDYGRRSATYAVNGENDVTINLPRGTAVRGTELSRADFLDGSVVFDAASPGGRYVPDEDASAIARMYYTLLGRAPEFAGEKYWVGIMDTYGYGIQTLAPYFYNSAEFKARYGENTGDAEFVGLLYRNILGRSGEQEGLAFWQGQLASAVGRDTVVVAISESIEHQAIRYEAIERGGIVFSGDPFL